MKRHEFHSALPPELVFAIVSTKAQEVRRPYLTSTFTAAERFFYRRNGECLWLTYTGTMPMRGFIPFSATVRAEEGGSVISGGFSPLRTALKPMAAIWGVMCAPVMLLGVPLPVYLFMFALGLLVGTGFRSTGQKVFFKKRQQAVLEFIEQHLLE